MFFFILITFQIEKHSKNTNDSKNALNKTPGKSAKSKFEYDLGETPGDGVATNEKKKTTEEGGAHGQNSMMSHSNYDKMVSAHDSSSEENEHGNHSKPIYNNKNIKYTLSSGYNLNGDKEPQNGNGKKKNLNKKVTIMNNEFNVDKNKNVKFDETDRPDKKKSSISTFESRPKVPTEEPHGKNSQIKEEKDTFEHRKSLILEDVIYNFLEEGFLTFNLRKKKILAYPINNLDVIRTPYEKMFFEVVSTLGKLA